MAQRILAEGHVRLDGQPIAKSNTTMRVGQVLTLPVHDQVRVVRVISLPHRRGPAVEAQSCYDDLSPNFPAASD
jgi:ribosome-associated heat shock protein Hsp15